ncbi:hypothetical protein MMC07_006644 [Pseudocyphellaria aurata]|nr:hypothetical protein [Pseudocyphellaria aurata]
MFRELLSLDGTTLARAQEGLPFSQAIPWDWKLVLALAVISTLAGTYLVTSWRSVVALTSHKQHGKRPPILPYWIPFVGSLIPYVRDTSRLAAKLVSAFGQSVPAGLQLGTIKLYVVGSPDHTNALFKTTPAITSNIGVVMSMKYMFGTPAEVFPLYARDDSGPFATPLAGSHVLPENRIRFLHWSSAHQHLASAGNSMGERYMNILSRNVSAATSIGIEWVEMPDLFEWIQKLAFLAATESLCGSSILSLHPTLTEDFWAFVGCLPTLVKWVPRWSSPVAHKKRDKMLMMVKEWHAFADAHSDFAKPAADDPEWDPYFGSKYVKARQRSFHGIGMMNADGRASEDLALLFAAHANSITAVFWTVFEVFSRPSLLSRVRDIAQSAHDTRAQQSESIQLDKNPLLQSVFAETTRLRVPSVMPKVATGGDYQLGEWSIPEGSILAINAGAGAMNKDVWNAGTAEEPHPLEGFWDERFLIYPNKPNSGPLRKQKGAFGADNQALATHSSTQEKPSHEPTFSLSGLGGAYIPFGGGPSICPGRHFARKEVVTTLSILALRFDVELHVPKGRTPKMDQAFFAMGTLPPAEKVPFRIRRRPLPET